MFKMVLNKIEYLERKTVFSSFLVLEASLRKNSDVPESAVGVLIHGQENFL